MEQWWGPIILIYPYSTSSFEHPRFYGTLSGSKARNLIRGDASRDARSVLQWDEILYNSGSKNILMFLPSSPWLGISQPQRGTQSRIPSIIQQPTLPYIETDCWTYDHLCNIICAEVLSTGRKEFQKVLSWILHK